VVVQVLYSASIFNRASKRQESSRGVWGMVNIKNKIGLGSAKKEEGRKKLFKIKCVLLYFFCDSCMMLMGG
jgi:hypothetical protein